MNSPGNRRWKFKQQRWRMKTEGMRDESSEEIKRYCERSECFIGSCNKNA